MLVSSALRFLVLAELLGLAALPLTALVLARLPGGAVPFAKPLGVLLAGWLVWLGAAAGLPYGLPLAAASVALVALVGALLWRSRRDGLRALMRARLFWAAEGVFVCAFAGMALLVSFAPDVWNTEKPMDMALINAINAGDSLPPHNPWLSGELLDGYYYFGHLLAALAIRLTGVEPTVGYNLGLALYFGLAVSAAFGLGASVAAAAGRPAVRAGLAAVGLSVVLGNLAGAAELLGHAGPLRTYPWFQASRVIPDTINEFPSFSWLLGDLHAHVMAVPFTLLALAFALQWLTAGARLYDVTAAGIVCGLLYAINAWSYPVVAGLLLLALAVVPGERARAPLRCALLLMAGLLAVAPFLLAFDPPAAGLGLVSRRQPFGALVRDLALIAGPLLWLVAAAFVVALRGTRRPLRNLVWGGVAFACAGTALAAGADLAGVLALGVGIVVAAVALARREATGAERFLWLLAFGGLLCLALPEVVFVRDAFAGSPLERMNTVFKLGYQAWLLLALAATAAVTLSASRLPRFAHGAWALGAVLLIAGAAVFPIAGSYARTNGFAGPARLDGLGWLRASAPGDVGAIAWLRAHAAPDAVLLEAVGDDYSPVGHGRMSTFTGRATVLGWSGHVLQWGGDPARRRDDVRRLYRAPDVATARPLLARYGVDYVVVGPIERAQYGDAGLAKWDVLGSRVFERADTTVWRIDR